MRTPLFGLILLIGIMVACTHRPPSRQVASASGAWPSEACLRQAFNGQGHILHATAFSGGDWVVAYVDPRLPQPRQPRVGYAARPVRPVAIQNVRGRCQAVEPARLDALRRERIESAGRLWCGTNDQMAYHPEVPAQLEMANEEGCFDVFLEDTEGQELVCREQWKDACG